MPTFARTQLHLPLDQAFFAQAISRACMIVLISIFGALSDHVGRRHRLLRRHHLTGGHGRCRERASKTHYFIVTLASARAAGMFFGGHGPDSTPTKAALAEIGATLVKLCWWSSISAGANCLFIFFSSSRFDLSGDW
jgi:hypothetical protein